ncbi:MAG: glucose 1-dehydrogenase [Proteobacteria bacterium]|nr:glucose 1-dehydrogenase [Pseudomonadota bacterium]
MGRLEGKLGLVTGAASGIGRATARVFAGEGARLWLADLDADAGEALAEELGGGAVFRRLDVSSEADWSALAGEVEARDGGLQVLVNSAGVMLSGRLEDVSLDDYMRVIRVNQVGTFLAMRAVIPLMRKAGGGSIVNLSSAMGLEGRAGVSTYAASKFAVRGMTKSVALELAEEGIRANAIFPGGVDTPMTRPMQVTERPADDPFLASIPMARIADPEEVARVALFLASDDSSYVTGADLVVDGGMLAGPWP